MGIQFGIIVVVGGGWFLASEISGYVSPWSQAIVSGLVRYGYGMEGQKETSVVLFREEHLTELGESFPVSYDRHAEVLEALASYQPRAVFVDFAFVDNRPGRDVTPLADAICALHESGTAVFLAVPRPSSSKGGGYKLRDGFDPRCFTPVTAAVNGEDGASGVLTYGTGAWATANPGKNERCCTYVWSPAFAMYDARRSAVMGTLLDPMATPRMEIIWGHRPSALNAKWMNCGARGAGALASRLWRHAKRLIASEPPLEKAVCPQTDTITVRHLLGPVDADVRRAITGKAVFYGGSFAMAETRVASPVYDDLPGVYLHAMAYDNLVTFGDDYKRADRAGLTSSTAVNGLLLMFTALLVLVADKPPAWARRLADRLAGVRGPAKVVVATVAIGCVLTAAARPTSWSAVILSIPLLLVVGAVLHVAATRPRPTPPPRQFLRVYAGALTMLAVAVALFLAVDGAYGIEAALLVVVLPAYVAYKTFVSRDVLFMATSVVLVCAAVVSYLPPINLGPRNIVAYLLFFDLVRRLLQQADRIAGTYFDLRKQHAAAEAWGVSRDTLRAVDWLFAMCLRGDQEEIHHEDAIAPRPPDRVGFAAGRGGGHGPRDGPTGGGGLVQRNGAPHRAGRPL